jgi:hypothetical protein
LSFATPWSSASPGLQVYPVLAPPRTHYLCTLRATHHRQQHNASLPASPSARIYLNHPALICIQNWLNSNARARTHTHTHTHTHSLARLHSLTLTHTSSRSHSLTRTCARACTPLSASMLQCANHLWRQRILRTREELEDMVFHAPLRLIGLTSADVDGDTPLVRWAGDDAGYALAE